MNAILVIGECGVGKTWVMRNLITDGNPHKKLGKFRFKEENGYIVLGKYDKSTFAGSDKLSMSVITDLELMMDYAKSRKKVMICEGDRFTNARFISTAKPFIIRILGDGEQGRKMRGSQQSERQLKSIKTRVNNIKPNLKVISSSECLNAIKKMVTK